MTEKREKKPDVTKRKLKAAGYTYRLEHLTKEEKKEQKEGIKEYDPVTKQTVTYSPPDLNYFYKPTPNGGSTKIFKVGDRFYYKNNWLRYMKQLSLIESDAAEEQEYAELQKLVVDTRPRQRNKNIANLLPGCQLIVLVGGPLDGDTYSWRIEYPMFMMQFEDDDRKVKSARYERDMSIVEVDGAKVRTNERVNVYNFKDIIG